MHDWTALLKIDSDDKVPLYHQIYENLRDLVNSGILRPGEAMPSEWDLSKHYQVSRLTVRKALDELAHEGWITRRHGVGTFAANPRVARIVASYMGFTEKMQQIGRKASSRVISFKVLRAAPEVAAHLEIESGKPIIELVRVRMADGEPVMLETAYLPQERFPDLTEETLGDGSLYRFLCDRYGVTVAAVDQSFEPIILSRMEAQLLAADQGSPALLSELVARSAEGLAIEYVWSVTRGDRCKFYFRFREGISPQN